MTDVQSLDRNRLKELFDLRSSYNVAMGGDFQTDPYPVWERLRKQAPVHEGTVHKLTGYPGEAFFQGLPFPDRPHFSAFSFAACDAAFRDEETFASSPTAVDPTGQAAGVESSLISMNGAQHRRYRALVQPSFLPAKSGWWISSWIEETVHLLIDSFVADGRAELNVDFCAAIPILTITGSLGIPVEQALIIREWLSQPAKIVGMLAPIVAARRESPRDDLISVLVQAELPDEDGTTHRLSDVEIYSFAILLLLAGSGTTWKQMGIILTALLQRPEILKAVRADRRLLRATIEEAIRWTPTDPMFSRFVTADIEFFGAHIPKGSVLHLCVAAANRDPERWERPDEFDIHRPLKRSLGFGGGMHICLGMHVARAEMTVGIGALLDRLPNLRLDPDAASPRIIGMYERGATEIPVLFG
ncbi:cytochrome P450 [Frankia sp. CNm7]|uniref:Cytochrome P450 n=1 Tax=Frankia nepalensis TaxID=1836974 RepID=A0A937RQF6_9ACTN|nr:cytochrome P450 [Frankia nepalensis]MBL7494990.1 cytochrome P450 [Frankia nepalensis]MBL7514667.1 cytochrome P450 [Frankia nepalensis]MBL7521860.1 cytochrome P450 [Frankia nepalensis]MBL7633100.1 cytochrome P450 [Frankia nepalensis]